MRQYNIFQAIYLSFYSKNLYRDVATNWGGKAFLYLLMIVALSWVLFTYQFQHSLNMIYAANADKLVAQMPVVTIKDGKISTPEERPYVIHDPETKQVFAVIDTTGKYTSLDEAKAEVLVTQTQIISRHNENQIRTTSLPNKLNMVIVPETVNAIVKRYLNFAWIFFFVIFVVAGYAYRLIQALIYSIIGKIFGVIAKVPLSYGQILQIAMVAITPVIVVATIFDFFAIQFAYQLLFYFILAMIYLFYGIVANRR